MRGRPGRYRERSRGRQGLQVPTGRPTRWPAAREDAGAVRADAVHPVVAGGADGVRCRVASGATTGERPGVLPPLLLTPPRLDVRAPAPRSGAGLVGDAPRWVRVSCCRRLQPGRVRDVPVGLPVGSSEGSVQATVQESGRGGRRRVRRLRSSHDRSTIACAKGTRGRDTRQGVASETKPCMAPSRRRYSTKHRPAVGLSAVKETPGGRRLMIVTRRRGLRGRRGRSSRR